MNAAHEAIKNGKGFQFVGEVMQRLQESGLSESDAAFGFAGMVEASREEDSERATILLRHLGRWMSINGVRGDQAATSCLGAT